MMLADLMTPSPYTSVPGATLRDAVELLARFGVSALPVVEGGQLTGLLAAQLPSNAAVLDAAELMRRTGSHGVLVVDDGVLTGIITTMDITRTLGHRGRDQ